MVCGQTVHRGLRARLWCKNTRFFSQSHRNPPRNSFLHTRTVFLTLGLGSIAGASFYLFYPDASRSAPTLTKGQLSPSHFTPTTVTLNDTCGPDSKLLQLTIPPNLLPHTSPESFAPVWSVFIKDDDIQVERPYTPLEGIDEHGRMLFWIKKYPKGEVGRWLHSKNVGEQIELRGPLKTWHWKDNTWDEIVMISGGTGITPFYQLLHSVIPQSSKSPLKTRFTLLHSSRTPAELPPRRILNVLTSYAVDYPDIFKLQIFVDSDDGSSLPSSIPKPQMGRIGKPAIEQCLGLGGRNHGSSWWNNLFQRPETTNPVPRKILFLVCGPEPMINAISGPFGRNFSQGHVGGVLGEMGLTSNQVWKL